MKAHRIILSVEQAEELVRLLPAGINAARQKKETVILVTVKVPETEIDADAVRAFAAGVPRDHVTGKLG